MTDVDKTYKPYGTSLQWVTKCVCGHAMEYHFHIPPDGIPRYNNPEFNDRCPHGRCECTQPVHDGGEPRQLSAVR